MRRAEAVRRLALALAALALASGCASRGDTLVVVVPAESGHVGGVVVNPGPQQQVLDTAYAAAWARGGTVEPTRLSAREVSAVFAEARDARPLVPASFTLYFREGSDEFSARSQPVVADIFSEIARRPAAEITVIGHSDRVGYQADNDRLSKLRAQRVRGDLIKLGIAEGIIRVAGRGEREPLVATPDEVDEPRNRRVEINVR